MPKVSHHEGTVFLWKSCHQIFRWIYNVFVVALFLLLSWKGEQPRPLGESVLTHSQPPLAVSKSGTPKGRELDSTQTAGAFQLLKSTARPAKGQPGRLSSRGLVLAQKLD